MAKYETWERLASEIGGEYSDDRRLFSSLQVRVVAKIGEWDVVLEGRNESRENTSNRFTVIKGEFQSPNRFGCRISELATGPLAILSNRGRVLIGDEEFDEDFRVKSSWKRRVQEFLQDRRVQEILSATRGFAIEAKPLTFFQSGPAEVRIVQGGSIVEDAERLKRGIDLLLVLLERLRKIGQAEPLDD